MDALRSSTEDGVSLEAEAANAVADFAERALA